MNELRTPTAYSSGEFSSFRIFSHFLNCQKPATCPGPKLVVLVRRTFCAEFEFGVQRAVNVATSYCVAECSFFLAKREIVLRLLTDQPATQLPLYIVGLGGWKTAQKGSRIWECWEIYLIQRQRK